jgi:DnaJ like chaperone protein
MMWWGRAIGAAVGIPAGVFGVLFGFLIGYLVDQLLKERVFRQRAERFLSGELGSRTLLPQRSALAPAGLGAYVATAEGPATERQVEEILRFLTRGRGRVRSSGARRLVEECVHLAPRMDPAALATYYRQSSTESERIELLRFLVDVARPDGSSYSGTALERVRVVADTLGIERSVVRELVAAGRTLDPESCRVLGVPPRADAAEVKRVYRQLAAQFHPDTASSLTDRQRQESEEAFMRIHRAYKRLMTELDAE